MAKGVEPLTVELKQEVPLDNAPPARELLKMLKSEGEGLGDHNTLLLISLGVLATDEAEETFWTDLSRMLVNFKNRQQAKLFKLSQTDRAFVVKMTEYNQVTLMTDCKVEILRLIQQYFPEQFGMIDQSRLIRIIDLRFKLNNAVRFLERYVEVEEGGNDAPKAHRRLRRLSEQDIDRVIEVNGQVGRSTFAKVFVQSQDIAAIKPGGTPEKVMHEYFVAMGALKEHVFPDVELRGSGNLFNQLTITLDRLLLDAFADANPGTAACSVNLNVESVFTRAFETFLKDAGEDAFANVAFEFRQGNVLQQYDEYEVATSLISQRGGIIAIDAIFPDTVGIVNMSRLNANLAKIFWRQGAEAILPKFEREIREMQDQGTRVVLARVDDDLGIEIGHKLGISIFQGFHIDDIMKGRDAA